MMTSHSDVHDCQEWVRTAPLDEVRDFLSWARGVLDMRLVAIVGRKKRKDAWFKRGTLAPQEALALREATVEDELERARRLR